MNNIKKFFRFITDEFLKVFSTKLYDKTDITK